MNINEILENNKGIIPLKKNISLTGIPLITLRNNRRDYHFLLDTGADRALIDPSLIQQMIGVKSINNDLEININTANGKINVSAPINIPMKYAGLTFNIEFYQCALGSMFATVEKDTQLKISGVIGVDFLTRNKYILDFNKMIAYIKK